MSQEMHWYVVSEDGKHKYGPYLPHLPLHARQAAEQMLRWHRTKKPQQNWRVKALPAERGMR